MEIHLPKNNQRRLTSALFVIEKRLNELVHLLNHDNSGVMHVVDDIPPETEKIKILTEIEQLKKELLSLRVKYNLLPRRESYLRTASSYISTSLIDLTEIQSRGMKGYGKFLDEKESAEYDRDMKLLSDRLRNFGLEF